MATWLDNHSRARTTIFFLWLTAGESAAWLIYNLLGVSVRQNRFAAIILIILLSATNLTAIVSFLAWFYRAYKNLDSNGINTSYAPGWTIGSFLVPLINWIRPYHLMEEIWRENAEMVSDSKNRPTVVLKWWWGCWVFSQLCAYLFNFGPDRNEFFAPACHVFANAGLLLHAAAAILATQVIRRISALESKTMERRRVRERSVLQYV